MVVFGPCLYIAFHVRHILGRMRKLWACNWHPGDGRLIRLGRLDILVLMTRVLLEVLGLFSE